MRFRRFDVSGPAKLGTISSAANEEPLVLDPQLSRRDDLTLASIARVWWYHRGAIFFTTLLALLGSCIAFGVADRQYKAETLVKINGIPLNYRTKNINLEMKNSIQERIEDGIAFLGSRSFLNMIASDLGLYYDPAFVGSEFVRSRNNSLLLPIRKRNAGRSSSGLNEKSSLEDLYDNEVRNLVIDTLADRISATQRGASDIISIEVNLNDSSKAAIIANKAASIFVADEERRLKSLEAGSFDVFDQKIRNLRGEVAGLEGEMLALLSEHDLHGSDEGQSMSQATAIQWSEFMTRLALIKAERSDLKARFAKAQAWIATNGIEEIAAITTSTALDELKILEADLERRLSELKRGLGDEHPKIIALRNDLAQTRDRMILEAYRAHEMLRGELLSTSAREAEIETHLERIKLKMNEERLAGVAVDDLRSRLDRKKEQLQNLLMDRQRLIQVRSIRQANATVVSPAFAPTSPDFPKFIPLALYVSFGGTLLGLAGVFLTERWVADFGFKSMADLRKLLYEPMGIVPNFDEQVAGELPLADYVVNYPQSVQAEGLQRIRGRLIERRRKENPKSMVVVVASSSPGDGKSSIVLSLARQSAMAGERALIVDADFRLPSIHRAIGVNNDYGLSEMLTENMHEIDCMKDDPLTSLNVIPAGNAKELCPDIFWSYHMADFIERCRQEFDWIYIDSPSLSAVADGFALANQADLTVYVAHWRKTTRDALGIGIRQLEDIEAKLAGVVLNKVDANAFSKYSDLQEFRHYGYYQNETPRSL